MHRRGGSGADSQGVGFGGNFLFDGDDVDTPGARGQLRHRPGSGPGIDTRPNHGQMQPAQPDDLQFYSPGQGMQQTQPYYQGAAPLGATSFYPGDGNAGYGAPAAAPAPTFDDSNGFMSSNMGNMGMDPMSSMANDMDGYTGGFDDEPPLLEELGINPLHIYQKTLAVLNPMKPIDPVLLEDTDLAGPLVFILALGALLVLHGKLHFGYLFGFGALGCVGVYGLVNMMSLTPIGLDKTISILGYCILPMLLLTTTSLLLTLRSILGFLLTGACIFWSTHTASLMFVRALALHEQRLLVAYPVALLYTVFALMTVF